MKIKFNGAYVSRKGTTTFRYTVQGTDTELSQYKEVQGENYREDETTKEALFFSIRRYADSTPLKLRRDGKKFYAETELLESVVENKVNNYKAMAHLMNRSVESMLTAMLGFEE